MSKIDIAIEYTDSPGGRFITDGECSGEDFRKRILKPKIDLLKEGEVLVINFDGAYGYPTSFLEEAFGGLAREIGSEFLLDRIELISNDEPSVIDRVREYIKNAKG